MPKDYGYDPGTSFVYKGKRYEYARFSGKYYRNGFEISSRTFKKAYAARRGIIPQSTRYAPELGVRWKRAYFSKSTWKSNPWAARRGQMRDWLRPLVSNPQYGRQKYLGSDGKLHTTSSKSRWGMQVKARAGGAYVLDGEKEFLIHLRVSMYRLAINAERFRIAVGEKALRIFLKSFETQSFVNEGGTKWQDLATFTKKQRAKRNTWPGKILTEYGRLARSLAVQNYVRKTSVYTKAVKSRTGQRLSYAGIHNEGVPKGAKWGKAIPRRQFMGFNNPNSMDMVDRFSFTISDRYLFHDVFLAKG